MLLQNPGNGAIVDTVAAVFRGVLASPRQPPLWLTILRWIGAEIGRLLGALSGHPIAGSVVRVALIAALIAVLLRILVPGLRGASGFGHARAARETVRDDWWALAQHLAGEGEFTDAAHALYLALVTGAAQRGLVTVHESKTSGDYLRELRRAAAGAGARRITASELAGWRDFVRTYETVIYGVGTCDDARYHTLHRLASAAIESRAA